MKTQSSSWMAFLIVSLETAAWLQAASTIEFTATTYIVSESAANATLNVQRLNDTNAAAQVDYVTADITATNGLKYAAVSGTLAFGAGQTNKSIVVPILNKGFVEGTKTFQVILSNPTGGAALGTLTKAIVSITDNDLGIQFRSATYLVAEDAGSILIGVVRGDDGNFPVTVDYATTNSTAISGLDYTGVTNTLSFAAGETLKLFTVPILNDILKEANESFRVSLSNPTGGGVLGAQKTTTVVIQDNDQGFRFEFASYAVAEEAGAVLISVLRGTDETNSPVTVDFTATDLTATNGLDYSGITNTLAFAPGQKVKVVAVPIVNDGLKEQTENFRVTLGNPTGGVLGSRITAEVTILDDDPGMGFELSSYSVWENSGAVTVTVLRGNDVALGPLMAEYATSDVTAKAGADYQAVSGTISFKENETVKTITIPILRNGLVARTTSFTVTLSSPSGGALLGTSATTVNILDATGLGTYRPVAPAFDAALSIHRDVELNILTWSGRGQLQRADSPAGPWQTLTNARSPTAVQSALPRTFYRIKHPRPVNLYIPASYDGKTPVPLVILLHGLDGTGADYEDWMQFRPVAETRGFLYCYPDGTGGAATGESGSQSWNDGNLVSGTADDASYLQGVIEAVGGQFAVDRKRVYVIGHSNGGFMAYRMACQTADLIAGIASLAGMTFRDPSRCQPSEPVNILHIHGTADGVISYAPLVLTGVNDSPGAMQTIQIWAGYNGARDPVTDPGPSMDLDLDVPGLETVITRYTNPPPGGAVELWTINGGSHGPTLYNGTSSSEFAPRVIDWLLAHPKP